MGEYAEAAYEGGFYTGNEGGRGQRFVSKRERRCPKCLLVFPNGNERRKHMRDVHGLKFDPKRIGCLIPVSKVTAHG